MEDEPQTREELIKYYEAKLVEKDDKIHILTTLACEWIRVEFSDRMKKLQEENELLMNIVDSQEEELSSKDSIILKLNQDLEENKYLFEQEIIDIEDIMDTIESEKIEVVQQMKAKQKQFEEKQLDERRTIKELLDRLSGTKEQDKIQTEKISTMEEFISGFRSELAQCATLIQEPRRLQERVTVLCQRHVRGLDVWNRDDAKDAESSDLTRERLVPTLPSAPKPQNNHLRKAHRARRNRIALGGAETPGVPTAGHLSSTQEMDLGCRDGMPSDEPQAQNHLEQKKFYELQSLPRKEEVPRRSPPLRLPPITKPW